MSQMSSRQARVADAVLSTVARGYRNQTYIGTKLFPYVPVSQRGGEIITFDKTAWRQYQLARAPGSNVKRINVGYASDKFSLTQHALEGQIPIEILDEANKGPGIDMASVAVTTVQDIIDLRLEIEQANLAANPSYYPAGHKVVLSGANQWNDYNNSTPIFDVSNARQAIRRATGKRPNVMVMGAHVWEILEYHPGLLDAAFIKGLIGNGFGDAALTKQVVSKLFEVDEIYIGDAIVLNENEVNTDVWGNHVVLAYSDVTPLASRGSPSYGYTYRLKDHPIAETPYYDNPVRSWIYPVVDEVKPVIAGADAGYLIKDAVA